MIKQPWFAIASFVVLLINICFIAERCFFLSTAEIATGSIIAIKTNNSHCGGGKRRRSYPCTKFSANVEFQTKRAQRQVLNISAGSSRGYDQPIVYANRKVGNNVPVIYDPDKPSKAYENTIFGVWYIEMILFCLQLILFFMSFFEPKNRKRVTMY